MKHADADGAGCRVDGDGNADDNSFLYRCLRLQLRSEWKSETLCCGE